MKMYEVLALQSFYARVQDKKMPIKTAYKLSRLAKRAEEEAQFYQKEFGRIVDEYAQKENGQLVYSDDMASIKIIPGKEDECGEKLVELRELDVDLSQFEFTIDEFDSLELTLAEMSSILPLIKD
jgi:hypothetical protein